MDFVEGLPNSHGKSVLFVVVDRLSKYAHFIPLSHPYTATTIAKVFFDNIFKLHGLPESIVSDRDVAFTSAFWTELFRLQGVKLCFSSAYHPQSDGQTEVVNRTIEMYLRCFTSDKPNKWLTWLPWAEFCYNTSFHTSLKATPFEIVYGRPPPQLLSYCPNSSRLESVDFALKDRDVVIADLRDRLLAAQQRMKAVFDASHRDVEFQVGDLVLLKLQPYRQLSLRAHSHKKLGPKFYGPFKILSRIGTVAAYKLKLPVPSRIHPVFHVSYLKRFYGDPSTSSAPALPLITNGEIRPAPQAIMDRRILHGVDQVLVHWEGLSPSDASWEDVVQMAQQFPDFSLEDKLAFEGGSDVIDSKCKPLQVYKRFSHGRKKQSLPISS